MASRPPRTREEERRLSIRTLAIASAASAAAAVVTSQFWVSGTWVAAAMTPVIVAVVSELLHKPTDAVARRMTTDRPAVVPEAAPQRPAVEPEPETERPVTVYGGGRSRTRKFALGVVGATAALGFVIGGLALTVPELLFGRSVTHRDRDTTLIPKKKDKRDDQPAQEQTTPTETVTQEQTTPTETETQQQTTPTETQPEQTTPTQTAPSGGQPGEPQR